MKNRNIIGLIITGIVVLGLYWVDVIKNKQVTVTQSSVINTNDNSTSYDIKLIGQYKISSGTLFIYKIGNDTIYLVEGRSSSYPVSLHVK